MLPRAQFWVESINPPDQPQWLTLPEAARVGIMGI